MIECKNFYIEYTKFISAIDIEPHIMDAYNYAVKHNCVVHLYAFDGGPLPLFAISENQFRVANQYVKSLPMYVTAYKNVVTRIKENNINIQYNWID